MKLLLPILCALCALCASAAGLHAAALVTPNLAGQVIPRASSEGVSPRLGIGFEKLDRDVFDPEKVYDKAASVGVKWVRIVSGWQRTEKIKGQYDFAWLDTIVDNLIKRGMTPWLVLLYGNEIHTPDAAKYYGAVGVPPIKTAREREAWANYVTALVKHFKGRIGLYEIWNEPDGVHCWKHGVNPLEYANFAIATSKAIRAADPSAQIAAGAIHILPDYGFTSAIFDAGLGNHIDAFTYHGYTISELTHLQTLQGLKALIHSHNPKIKLIQGEAGAQSHPGGMGALRGKAWTERKQAKWLLRHLITHLSLGVEFTSYFSTIDMIEALTGKVGDKSSYLQDYNACGVFASEFDANGRAVGEFPPKPSYHAFRNLCAALPADVEMTTLPVRVVAGINAAHGLEPGMDTVGAALQLHGFKKTNGARALAFWNATDLLATEYDGAISLAFANLPRPVRLVDLMTGAVYDIPDAMLTPTKMGKTSRILRSLPLKDYPCLLTFGEFLSFKKNIVKNKKTP